MTKQLANSVKKQNGTVLLCLASWRKLLVSTYVKVLKFTLKVNFRLVNGKIQSGQDRYTTEVVVQGFNGVMQMLGGRAQGGAPAQGGMGNQQQGGWGQPQQPQQQQQQYSAPAQQQPKAPQQAPQQAQPQYNEPPMDFDDDIPF